MNIFDFLLQMQLAAVICFLLGIALVTFEMFHPGFGAPGITGLVLLVLSIVLTAQNLLQALIMIIIILVILGVVLSFVLRSASRGYLSKVLILSDSMRKETGYIGTEDLKSFLGREGTAITVLRPAGAADFAGIKLDVVSEGGFIAKGKKIKIVKVEGRRIVVRDMDD